jgi:hypothetical protein
MIHAGNWYGQGLQKPRGGFVLDEGHPFAPNALCFPLSEAAGGAAFDMYGRKGTFSGPVSWDAGEFGSCLRFMPGSAARMNFSGAKLGTTCWFAVRFLHLGASTSYQALLADGPAAVELTYRGALGKIDFVYSALDHVCATTVTGNVWHTVVVSSAAGAVSIYLDGKLDGSFTGFPGFTAANVGDDTFGDALKGLIGFVYGHDGSSLDAAQALELSANPYSMFRSPVRSLMAPVFFSTPPSTGHKPVKWFPGMDRRWLRQHRPGRMR